MSFFSDLLNGILDLSGTIFGTPNGSGGSVGGIFQNLGSSSTGEFGVNIMSGTGRLIYSTAVVTWNQVDFFYLPGGQTFSKFYQVLVGKEVLVTQLFVNPPPLDRAAVAYTISSSNGTVTLSGGSEAVFVLVLMR